MKEDIVMVPWVRAEEKDDPPILHSSTFGSVCPSFFRYYILVRRADER